MAEVCTGYIDSLAILRLFSYPISIATARVYCIKSDYSQLQKL